MNRRSSRRAVFLCFLLTLLLCSPVYAAKAAVLKTVQVTASGCLKAEATIQDLSAVPGERIYLYALPFTGSKIDGNSINLANRAKSSSPSFSVNLKKKYDVYLNRRYALAARQADGSMTIISNLLYPTGMSSIARYQYDFPKTSSKKGLQIREGMDEDIEELHVQHSVINIVFTEMLASAGEAGTSASVSYSYNGRTYWFRKNVISYYDSQLKALKKNNAVVSAILLLGYRKDYEWLIPPGGRQSGHLFYAWNTGSSKARAVFSACLSFLSERYAPKNGANGRIVNWIVGNEVNNYEAWFYGGQMSLSAFSRLYASAFRLTYNTVTAWYANARVYISLDYMWNTRAHTWTFTGRETIESFAKTLSSGGAIPWNLAYHPYSCPLTEPRFWENKNHMLTASLSSPVINMANLSLLTTYIRKKYGENTRIILSEQGYTSVQNGKNVQRDQSAAIVYSYYLAEADPMVDSFIMNRQVDHLAEVNDGLACGLWTTKGTENASDKKNAWTVYKYMDTSRSPVVSRAALSVIGISSWTDVIPGFSQTLYSKSSAVIGKLVIVPHYKKTAGINTGWKAYGAARKPVPTRYGLSVKRSADANINRNWGYVQQFSAPLSFASHPCFCTDVKISGASAGNVKLKLRFFSGGNTFECFKTIPSGKAVRLAVSLKNWKYRDHVTKIQILAERTTGGWKNGAQLNISWPARGSV